MDTTGGERLGRFWADALGLEFHPDEDAGYLTGPSEGHGIAMGTVPEAKTVKHRVHIDVHTAAIADLERLGASVVLPAEESGLQWTVMADPEGGEFCAFVREPDKLPDYRFFALIVDAVDAEHIAQWWGEVFGVEPEAQSMEGWFGLEGVPGMPYQGIVFGNVPEPKTVKNRIHWDLHGTVAEMEAAGATLLRARDDEIRWNVMADPEGNEFCVFEP